MARVERATITAKGRCSSHEPRPVHGLWFSLSYTERHGGLGSNQQPPELETGALPIELPPCVGPGSGVAPDVPRVPRVVCS